MNPEISTSLEELAYACRILSREGHDDLTLGHLSMRDPDGRGVWLKRSGISLGEVQGADDFILIDYDGQQLEGSGQRHKEWPIHTEILRARPDAMFVGHSHPFHAAAFSALDVELVAVTNEAVYLGGVPGRLGETTLLIDTPELGAKLAAALGGASTVLMRNHGIAFVGPDVQMLTVMGLYLDRACRSHLAVLATGQPYSSTPPGELAPKQKQILGPKLAEAFWSFLKRQVDKNQ